MRCKYRVSGDEVVVVVVVVVEDLTLIEKERDRDRKRDQSEEIWGGKEEFNIKKKKKKDGSLYERKFRFNKMYTLVECKFDIMKKAVNILSVLYIY